MEPTLQKHKDMIEKIQHRFTKIIEIWRTSQEDKLRYLGLWTLKERKNRQDSIELFKTAKGLSRVRIDELFIFDERY